MGFLDMLKEPEKKDNTDYCTCDEICPHCGKPKRKKKYNPVTGFQ